MIAIKTLFIFALSLQLLCVHFDYSSNDNRNQNLNYPRPISFLKALNFAANTAAMILNSSENEFKRYLQRFRNRLMHARNGNRANNKKQKCHIKTLIVNKGSSNYSTNKNVLINLVETEKPDIMIVSEANLEIDNKTLDIDFKNHKVESKYLGNSDLARIMVLVHKSITYERMTKLETEDNAMIVLRVKTATNKYVYYVCVYWILTVVATSSKQL